MPYKQSSRIKPSSFLLPLGRLDTVFFQPSAGWMGTPKSSSQPASYQASWIVDKSAKEDTQVKYFVRVKYNSENRVAKPLFCTP